MKLKVTFSRTSKAGIIEVRIAVEDQGDYESMYIFDDSSDFPTNDGWELGDKEYACIKHTIHIRDAQQWAENQIKALKEKLQEWRSYTVPEDYYVEI